MGKRKRKLTPAEKAEKKRRQQEFTTIFVSGKQKRVKREPTVDGILVDEFIRRNADLIWLLQNEMYEELYQWEQQQEKSRTIPNQHLHAISRRPAVLTTTCLFEKCTQVPDNFSA